MAIRRWAVLHMVNIHSYNMWNNIIIQQAQQIDKIRVMAESTLDVESQILAIVFNVDQSKIDALDWGDYLAKRKALAFLETPPSQKPVQYVRVGDKRYKFVYDIRKMPFARYIEGKTFAADFMGNLHKIAASIVIPQRRGVFGWKDEQYEAIRHEEYANDMLLAPFEAVYANAVFFYQVFRKWIEVSKDFLIQEQVSKGMSEEAARTLVADLCKSLDGNIPLKQ